MKHLLLLTIAIVAFLSPFADSGVARADERVFRLYDGITAYVNNPDGKAFKASLDVRDLNLLANGPREVLVKVYDPSGKNVVRQIIPDDGCTTANFPDRIGGWDHELQYYANLYAKGTNPSYRWSAWSDPKRLGTIVKRTFDYDIPAGGPGVYRIVIAGTPDHYVSLRLSPDLKYGITGHPTWVHGHGNSMPKSYLYVPQGTVSLFMAVAEPDMPRTRHFKLTGPDGKVLFDSPATGGYTATEGGATWRDAKITFADPKAYEGKLLTLEVTDNPAPTAKSPAGDYLVRIVLQRGSTPEAGGGGQGSLPIFASDPETANALRSGVTVVDGQVFWHPYQVKFYQWLKANPLNADDAQKALRKELETLCTDFRTLETSDGTCGPSWVNWAYNMGYYGFKAFRPSWVLMKRDDVPAEVKAIIKEGILMAGDRLSFAVNAERVNGNAFSQINVALWYAHQATGDALQKERFEVFFTRWKTEGWGPGSGISVSGDSQEHFSHDAHYGSYLMDNWQPAGTWVKPSITEDAKDEPRFKEVLARYQNLYTYIFCREVSGVPVAANPWSTRTHMSPHNAEKKWESPERPWKGMPGPDLTDDVNGGHEWFAARRAGYYILTFHGRIAPEWMSECFEGQLGFSGGTICQFTVPGKGPVLAGTLFESYGRGMSLDNWAKHHVHALAGITWDGRPFSASISEQEDPKLTGNKVTGEGEVRNAHIRSSRSYTYEPDGVVCEVRLAPSNYAKVLSIWAHERNWSQIKEGWEILPFIATQPDAKTPTAVTGTGADGKSAALTAQETQIQKIRIDRGGFGVDVVLEKPALVKLGANNTVMILVARQEADKPVAADQVGVKYKLVPFGAK